MYTFSSDFLQQHALNVEDFFDFTERILQGEIKTPPYTNPEYVSFTQVNHKRFKKLLQKINLHKKIYNLVQEGINAWTWVVITEPWCSDASFIVPVLYAISKASNGHIDLKLLLRDTHPEIMNEYLTNGGMAIPKLISLDAQYNELGTWGPRPADIQQQIMEWKKDPKFTQTEKIKRVNMWYRKDHGESIQNEFIHLIKQWKYEQ